MKSVKKAVLIATAGTVVAASTLSGAMAATTTAGKCGEAYLKMYDCVTNGPDFSGSKTVWKFCKSGATEATKLGEKLEKEVNKCGEKFNNAMEKLECASAGDPDGIANGNYTPLMLPLLAPGDGATILNDMGDPIVYQILCDGADEPMFP